MKPEVESPLNRILNCGVGGEIEAARSTLDMVEELNPDGGYIYPVSLYPSNWFKLLDSSFTGVDLLESPAALSQRMRNLEMQRNNIVLNISKLTSVIPDKQEVKALADAKKKADEAFQSLVDECVKNNIAATADTAKAIVALCKKKEDSDEVEMPDKTEVARVSKTDKDGKEADMEIQIGMNIAKDVSIRFTSQTSVSSSFAESIEDHASQGGGFLIFSGNSSSASSSSQSAAMASSNANSVTVRFTAPQILGYYMQATPADKSTHINSTSDNEMSIIGFVSKFKEMIEDYNKNIREARKKAEAT